LGSEQFSLSDQIQPQDASNLITASCIGEQLSLTVNGKLLRTTKESSFSSGKVGMVVETRTDGGAAVVFSDFFSNKNAKMKVYLDMVGCRLNQAEIEQFALNLERVARKLWQMRHKQIMCWSIPVASQLKPALIPANDPSFSA